MLNEGKPQVPIPFNWGEFFAGFFIAIVFNTILITLCVLLAENNIDDWGLFFITGIFVVNIFINIKLPKRLRSFSRGWTVTLVLLAIPLLAVGVCLSGY